jgi:hypothetical protein
MAPPETYSSSQVVANAVRALVAFGRIVWTLAIWLAIWALVWLPLALAAWFLYRRHREAPAG